MTIVESGAKQLISQFGVDVKIYPQESDSPQDSSNPVFFDDTNNSTNFTEEKVRLYTSASEEIMKDYGLDEVSDAVMYATDNIANQGDEVAYEAGNYNWIVEETMTNQIDADGPYIYIYSLGAI